MKKLFLIIAILFAGCTTPTSNISEDEVKGVIRGFFDALDVENDDPNMLDKYVTDDFIIYEAGKKMTRDEFKEFVSGGRMTESNWDLSDYRISTDVNSAHASLLNKGRFVFPTNDSTLTQTLEWLESAYLVKVEDKLKIKFYFSDNIKAVVE